jgi:hypothetical protein
MDDATAKHLWALRNINDALMGGLQTAIAVLENVDKLSEERRLSLLDKLKELVAAGQRGYENEPKH